MTSSNNSIANSTINNSSLFSHVKTDLSAGLVVFLIALPLCLGISLASGAPLFSGVISGIIGGIIVGLASNSKINVSGPAASVALVVLSAIQSFGSFQIVLSATIIAGIIQIILGYLRAGTVAYFFPNAMIKGILASIGLILIIKQLPHALGYHKALEGLEFRSEGPLSLSYITGLLDNIHPGTTLITLISLAIILIWDRPQLKRYPFFKFVPSALIAVITSIFVNLIYQKLFPSMQLTSHQLVELPIADGFEGFLSLFSYPDFSQILNPELYFVAFSIAFIASLESLLSTEAGDKLDPYRRRTSTNRELKAQGIGNIVAGFIGGLPITAVIVRTSANVTSGGRTPLSTITHGVIMLICVISIPHILNMIPLASLSAVLFVVGYRLTSLKLFKTTYKEGKRQFLPFIVTIIAVMIFDLIIGIAIGGSLAIFLILRESHKNPYFFHREKHQKGQIINIRLAEEVTFLNKASIMLTLDNLPDYSKVIIDGTNSVFIDKDVIEIIEEFRHTAQYKHIELELIGLEKYPELKESFTLE